MKIKLALVFVLGLAIGLLVGSIFASKQTSFGAALEENKVAAANLRFYGADLTPQLREYLKARIYCNVNTFYPNTPGYLLQKDWDFGPVDRSVLGKILVFKDPNQIVWDWPSAITNK
ncbi:MAG TPA: hypothetical protein VN836_08520 [Verrucomicrobiae bacterium]|nr:hypothetical protein [Verrucomicrobiae bacterium]